MKELNDEINKIRTNLGLSWLNMDISNVSFENFFLIESISIFKIELRNIFYYYNFK